jgi:hypothetical protein
LSCRTSAGIVDMSLASDPNHAFIRRRFRCASITSGSDSATCHGLQALKVYGIDDSDLTKSMQCVSAVLAVLVEKWCRLEQIR